MNKNGEGNPKSLMFAIIIFSLVLVASINFMTAFMDEYGYDEPTDFATLNELSSRYNVTTSNMTDSMKKENRNLFQRATDQIQDMWFGGVMSPIIMVWDSYGLLIEYSVSMGGILDLNTGTTEFIVPFIQVLLIMTVLFAVIYFVRSGK